VLSGRPRLEVVPLSQIVGTVDPTTHFDACFRPATEMVRRRWERIALAQRRGIPLPPVELVQGPRGYYVVDGRHRVSVARALRHADTDAWVYGAGAPDSAWQDERDARHGSGGCAPAGSRPGTEPAEAGIG
jgi:hypothetical protein